MAAVDVLQCVIRGMLAGMSDAPPGTGRRDRDDPGTDHEHDHDAHEHEHDHGQHEHEHGERSGLLAGLLHRAPALA
jgi:ABC-type Zn2+ transport system substrate-binding protein/surface adhesin